MARGFLPGGRESRRLRMSTQRLLMVQGYGGRCSVRSSIYTCPAVPAASLEHLGPQLESGWRELGKVALNEDLNEAIARGVTQILGAADLADITSQRDDMLLALLQLKAEMTGAS
jgi:hypothetical protein